MVRGISAIDSINSKNLVQKTKQQKVSNPILSNEKYEIQSLKTVPYGYISFKGNDGLSFKDDALKYLDEAEALAKELGHTEIAPEHIIHIAIEEMDDYNEQYKTMLEQHLDITEPDPTLLNLANNYSGKDMYSEPAKREHFIAQTELLYENNSESLSKLPLESERRQKLGFLRTIFKPRKIGLSNAFTNELKEINGDINAYALLATAFNTLTHNGTLHASDYLLSFATQGRYKSAEELEENYLKQYDNRAIEAWNKLALGSSLFVTSKNKEERDRLEASIFKTLNAEKHGNFNSENTLLYSFSPNVTLDNVIEEASVIKTANPDKKLVFMLDYDDIINKIVIKSDEGTGAKREDLFGVVDLDKENIRFILFQDESSYYELMQTPVVKKTYANFIQHSVPPIQSYEVADILKDNEKLLENVKHKFTDDAKNKAIILAEKLEGCYPDKAIDLLERISEYFGNSVEKITTKEVEEFGYIANDIFNQDDSELQIIYNTGKTLDTYYGKETTKKDIITLVEQIKTRNIGTQGIIITAKDQEAGAGKKYTAEVIAGEAKVPFLELNPADFALTSSQIESGSKLLPASYINKAFTELKFAAKQNPNKTAILYISNFEDLLLTDIDYHGYKQARAQLTKEIELARNSDVNILVIGSTFENLADYVPVFIKDFNRKIIVDSPAFNKASRKEILENLIKKEKIQLAYKTIQEKEEYINKLVKLTEYFSYVDIKNLVNKASEISIERAKKKTSMGEFIEAYLQLVSGRTSLPEMPEHNKKIVTSHECGHAVNLEVMNDIFKNRGKLWHVNRDVNFITLDPRGDFLGAVFEGHLDNQTYAFESMFSDIVCAYGGHSCEKEFFGIDSSSGPSSDFNQATSAAKRGVEYYGMGYNTGKISNGANIVSAKYNENVFKDVEVILTNAQIVSDLITEHYRDFNVDFTKKYSKLIGSNNCMIDGDVFRKQLKNWVASRPEAIKEDLKVLEEIIMDIIKATKKGKIYGKVKTVVK